MGGSEVGEKLMVVVFEDKVDILAQYNIFEDGLEFFEGLWELAELWIG